MGTEPDFREFVQTRYTELLRVAYLLTSSTPEAEDLVQNALVRIMRHWRRIEQPLPYARRTIVNLHLNGWRRRSRELLIGFAPDRAVPDSAERVAETRSLLAVLAALPPRMRAIIVLRYWVDLSEAETAEMLGCSIGNVKSTASRGLARLRDVLGAPSTSDSTGRSR